MSLPEIVTREQWQVARDELLLSEKKLTRQRDALNADRRRLPMVRVEEDYVFEGPDGKVTLADLFDGSDQLIVQHVMFHPDWEVACQSCSADLDESTSALLAHLKTRNTQFVRIARAPYEKIAAYREARGWTFPFFSSFGTSFNADYRVTVDDGESPGFSCFLKVGDDVFHTYSTYNRGTENVTPGAYALLDVTALGRQEDWEEPKGRAAKLTGADPSFLSALEES